jgi:hypothetical protein
MQWNRSRTNAAGSVPVWTGLMPVGIAALGAPAQPVERSMGAQRAVYRLIVALGRIRPPVVMWPHRRAPRSGQMVATVS